MKFVFFVIKELKAKETFSSFIREASHDADR